MRLAAPGLTGFLHVRPGFALNYFRTWGASFRKQQPAVDRLADLREQMADELFRKGRTGLARTWYVKTHRTMKPNGANNNRIVGLRLLIELMGDGGTAVMEITKMRIIDKIEKLKLEAENAETADYIELKYRTASFLYSKIGMVNEAIGCLAKMAMNIEAKFDNHVKAKQIYEEAAGRYREIGQNRSAMACYFSASKLARTLGEHAESSRLGQLAGQCMMKPNKAIAPSPPL